MVNDLISGLDEKEIMVHLREWANEFIASVPQGIIDAATGDANELKKDGCSTPEIVIMAFALAAMAVLGDKRKTKKAKKSKKPVRKKAKSYV